MASTPIPTTTTPAKPIALSSGSKWLIGTFMVSLVLYYFIGIDQGATSVLGNNMYIHEFVHDARHLLGFPCH